MIFVTVGTQLPFPRLVSAMNRIAATLDEEVIAQTGAPPPEDDAASVWPHLTCHERMRPADFDASFARARAVVAHAGIGSILSARRWGKPLVVLPRRHALGEHRNDHQLATARQLSGLPGLHVAWETEDLPALLTAGALAPPGGEEASTPARDRLVLRLRNFIES